MNEYRCPIRDFQYIFLQQSVTSSGRLSDSYDWGGNLMSVRLQNVVCLIKVMSYNAVVMSLMKLVQLQSRLASTNIYKTPRSIDVESLER